MPGSERTSHAGTRVQVVERADGALSVRHHGAPITIRLAPPLAGTLHTAQAELASHPDHERIVSGGVLPTQLSGQAADQRNNGAAPQAAANGRALPPPTPRQLGISCVTVSNCVHANGVPGRRTSAAAS